MSFASALNEYCKTAECTNRQIAELSGVSASALSRYRHGEREPEPKSPVMRNLAKALAQLSAENNPDNALDAAEVNARFEEELASPQMAGMDFNMRLDALMHLIGARNTDFAEVAGVDQSYISHIRRGQRTPADMRKFASVCSHLAANLCIERNYLNEVGELIGTPEISAELSADNANLESEIAEVIEVWLTGGEMFTTDIIEMHKLFEWLDSTDLSKWLTLCDDCVEGDLVPQAPVARFYYGLSGMHTAEMEFLNTALKSRARNLMLCSDMSILQLGFDPALIDGYMGIIGDILRNGGEVGIVHNLERPLKETIQSLRLWIPLYITGHVTPSYLRGLNNRLFCHVNRVCDTCALSAEAVMGHQEDGRYYFSTYSADIEYYQKKMTFIIEKTSPLLEVYRECDPMQKKQFREAEAARMEKGNARRIGADRYENLRITSYPGDCVVLSIPCGEYFVHLVSRHPKITYIAARM